MSKVFFSAMMFAMLCTGNLSPEIAANTSHLKDFNSQTVAQYQILSQSANADLQDDYDDDEDEEQEALS